MIEVRPIAPALGAEIHGLDLSTPLAAAELASIQDAIDKHLVVFFPDQKLSADQHVAFGQSFGPLIEQHPPYLKTLDGHPEVVVLEGQAGGKADLWHTDITWFESPPMGSILHAHEIPELGGDTMWANTYLAYETLSPRMQSLLDGAVAVHDLNLTAMRILRERSGGISENPGREGATIPRNLPSNEHPVVRTHPRTGRKGLFVNSAFTSHIKDMNIKESDAVLEFLYAHSVQPEFTVRRRWQAGDVGFCDNQCTMHYALADYGDHPRTIHRVTLEGTKPV